MYRLTVDDKENYILVMRNILSSKLKIHYKYDVKVSRMRGRKHFIKLLFSFEGSTVDRSASDKEKLSPCPTLKDNDFLETRRIIELGPEQKNVFMERLKRDVDVSEMLHSIYQINCIVISVSCQST